MEPEQPTKRQLLELLGLIALTGALAGCARLLPPFLLSETPAPTPTLSPEAQLKAEKLARAYDLIGIYKRAAKQTGFSWNPSLEIVPSNDPRIAGHGDLYAATLGYAIVISERILKQSDALFDGTVFHEAQHADISQVRIIPAAQIRQLYMSVLMYLDESYIKDTPIIGFDIDLNNERQYTMRATASLSEASADLAMIYVGEKSGIAVSPVHGKAGAFLRHLNEAAQIDDLECLRLHRNSDVFAYAQKVLRSPSQTDLVEIKILDRILEKLINGRFHGNDQSVFIAAEYQLFTALESYRSGQGIPKFINAESSKPPSNTYPTALYLQKCEAYGLNVGRQLLAKPQI